MIVNLYYYFYYHCPVCAGVVLTITLLKRHAFELSAWSVDFLKSFDSDQGTQSEQMF